MFLSILKYAMAAFYILAGINHFTKPHFYIRIIPPFLPFKKTINIVSGAIEIILGIMLVIPMCQSWAAWGIIILLILVFPANIYHLISRGAGMNIPIWALWIRLPIQGLFIYGAYLYT